MDDTTNTRAFFEAWFRDIENGFIEFRLLKSWEEVNKDVQRFWCSSDRVMDTLHTFQDDERDIYFGTCPRREKNGTQEYVSAMPGLWADMDGEDFDGSKDEAHRLLTNWIHPPSIVVDSGNGLHAYWALQESRQITTDEDRAEVRGYLKGLSEALGGDHTFDLARILRVPGTRNLKDPNNPKPVRIVEFHPDRRYNVSDFESYWVDAKTSKVDVDISPAVDVPERFHELLSKDAKVKATWERKRPDLKDQTRSGYDMALASLLVRHDFSDPEIAAILRGSPSGKGEEATQQYLAVTIGKAEAGAVEHPPAPGDQDAPSPKGKASTPPKKQKELRRWTLSELEDIMPETTWLWQDWLPKGYLSELVGEQGLGKSNVALALAASVIRGDEWPDGTEAEGDGKVLWVDTEASQALLCDRVRRWRLPASQIILPMSEDPLADVRLDEQEDWERVETTVLVEKPQLVIVDSLSAGHRKDENSAQTLDICHKLAALARDCEIAVLVVHHLRKRGMFDGEVITLDRIRGHSSITQLARVVIALDRPDATQPERLCLKQIKNNLTREPEPVGVEIGDDRLIFGDAPEKPRGDTQLERAKDILFALLAKGPKPVSELKEDMDGAGISWRTAQEAKKRTGIVARKEPEKQGRWIWGLPTPREETPI